MLSKRTKKQALSIKKIAENSNPRRSVSQPSQNEGTKGVKPNVRALGS